MNLEEKGIGKGFVYLHDVLQQPAGESLGQTALKGSSGLGLRVTRPCLITG